MTGATWVAGPYSLTWNSLALGVVRGDEQAPIIEKQRFSQVIRGTNNWAETPVGAIGQGSEAFFSAVFMEWKTNVIQTIWPYSDAGYDAGIGVDDWDLAQALVLTAAAGTLAVASPATVTATKAYLAENFPVRVMFGPRLREVPIRMRLWSYYVAGSTGPTRTHLLT